MPTNPYEAPKEGNEPSTDARLWTGWIQGVLTAAMFAAVLFGWLFWRSRT